MMNVVSLINKEHIEAIGDNHISSNVDTPLLQRAFDKQRCSLHSGRK